jgi:hypothetical protein
VCLSSIMQYKNVGQCRSRILLLSFTAIVIQKYIFKTQQNLNRFHYLNRCFTICRMPKEVRVILSLLKMFYISQQCINVQMFYTCLIRNNIYLKPVNWFKRDSTGENSCSMIMSLRNISINKAGSIF